nr:hypothetical protein [uncultured Dyadobacter sp.]
MKTLLKSLVMLGISTLMFSCNNNEEPLPDGVSASEAASLPSDGDAAAKTNGFTIVQPNASGWRLTKTLSVPMEKGFNITSPYAITDKGLGDISWGVSVCYPDLKPVKVAFHNLGIVDIPSVKLLAVKQLVFNQYIIASAPAGSASWTNYMPAKTIIAAKTPAGKYYLLEIVTDNPLKVNIYTPVRI